MRVTYLSKQDAIQLLEIIHDSLTCNSEEQATQLMSRVGDLLPYEAAASFITKLGPENIIEAIRIVNVDYPSEYISELIQQELMMGDPIPEVAYTYNIDGQSYRSSRITFGAVNKLNAGKTVARYPKGKHIQVFYNPLKPDQAVLEPVADTTSSLVFIGLGVGLAFMGVFSSANHLKRTRAMVQA